MKKSNFYLLFLVLFNFFLRTSTLNAMQNDSFRLFIESEHSKTKEQIEIFPFDQGSLEDTIRQIDEYLESNIQHNQAKVDALNTIYEMYKKGQKGKAKTELINLCGDKLGNLDNSNFLSNILYLKDLYNKVLIYNATTFRRDLYENIQGDFKYPRTPVGAALISNAALLEQKEYNQLQNTKIFLSLPHYIGKLSCEGSKFYENLQMVIFPYWIQSRMEDEVGFGKQTIEQNNSYKRRSEALKEQALKEQALKTKTPKKKRPKRKTRGKTKVVPQQNTNLQKEDQNDVLHPSTVDEKTPNNTEEIGEIEEENSNRLNAKEDQNDVLHPSTVDEKTPNNTEEIGELEEEKNSNRLDAKEDPNDVLHTSTVDEKTLNTTEEIGELEEEKISHTIIVDKVTPRAFSLFDTEGISNKYKNVLKSIYAYKMKDSKVKHKEAVEWNDVVNMMTNAFKGKMYGVKGGSSRQFAIYLYQEPLQPITFITFDEYNRFRKKAQNNSKINYTLSQKVVYTEKPHSRGRAKKGMTRNLYPTLIELLASSLDKVGLTPQNLGWE